ncbi:fatty acid desaturase family protein [Streptomyces yaizuensis]|uniref:Fatty acid desaturase n=1 Tax=Streptomyces yaizuensis TaxID=2989713 RepID=A0ABQ5P6B2_9ACTN|nr:fatty acid desaturase [Streptomyces sp. YSPA8]GLF98094.1 fatty acid desaturase [Streptomyces sp. YSPA8]
MGSPVPRPPRRTAARGRTRPGTGASGPVRRALGRPLLAELEQLCGRPSAGPADMCLDLAAITAAAVLGHLAGHVVGPLLAVAYIGVRQRHLSNLAHECVHMKLMVTRRGNRAAGVLLTFLLGEGFAPYRSSHTVHHARLGSAADPMLQSYRSGGLHTAGLSSRGAFVVRVIVRAALWRLPSTAVRTLLTRAPGEQRRSVAARAAVWALVATAAWYLGVLPLVLLYWLVPLVFVRPLVTWITDLGNHAGLIDNDDVLLQTRGWSSHWLTRHLLGGHLDDMYHPLHHWCPRIPWRRLPEARALAARHLERWDEVPWCSGYFFRRRSTPDRPCVIEDIITRLNAPAPATGAPSARHTA